MVLHQALQQRLKSRLVRVKRAPPRTRPGAQIYLVLDFQAPRADGLACQSRCLGHNGVTAITNSK